jgi:hypothetical protein
MQGSEVLCEQKQRLRPKLLKNLPEAIFSFAMFGEWIISMVIGGKRGRQIKPNPTE